MSDTIERTVTLAAPPERVWRAVSDHHEFGQWFRVALDQPFAVGTPSTGRVTYPGFEHLPWEAEVVAIEPLRRLAFRWVPGIPEPHETLATSPSTLVEFLLEPEGGGTRLTVRESGFGKLPPDKRIEAMRMNSQGWDEQIGNVRAHVDG